MAIFSNAAFPLLVGLCYVLGHLSSQVNRTTWFGALNALAVAILFGWRSTVMLLILSALCWGALITVVRFKLKLGERSLRNFAGPLLYVAAALLFITHKSLLEPQNDFRHFPLFFQLARLGSVPWVHVTIYVLQLIALSYVFLRLIDLIRSVLDGARLLDPLAISGFLAPFFMTPAGPVNVYTDHVKMDEEAVVPVTIAHFVDSMFLIICGYFLKFVIAQSFSIFMVGLSGNWPTNTIGGTAVFLLYIFLEFSGYSLIALGVGRLLCVPTPVNFNHPYFATTVGEFWNRWHMSLGQFVRRNLYIPIQVFLVRRFGRKNRNAAYVANIFALSVPFVFVGIWHRFTWSFLLWGITLGIVVAVEKVIREKVLFRFKALSRQPTWLMHGVGIIYTLTIVVITLHIAARDFLR